MSYFQYVVYELTAFQSMLADSGRVLA